MFRRGVFTFLGVLLIAGAGWAADPAAKCQAAKLKQAGKYGCCRLKAESKAAKKGEAPDYSECDAKFRDKWFTLESKIGEACPKGQVPGQTQAWNHDVFRRAIEDHTNRVTESLLVDGSPESGNLPYCKPPATGQTTCWDESYNLISCAGTGQDGDTQAGSKLAFVYGDGFNANGTITDPRTGLMWEVKDNNDAGGIHDKDDTYTWEDAVDPNGPFLRVLNHHCWMDETVGCRVGGDGACTTVPNDVCGFAGYRDWRLPNVKELPSIIDYEQVNPAVDPVFHDSFNCSVGGCTFWNCSCTESWRYWSATTLASFPNHAWGVYFDYGYVGLDDKVYNFHVRAVRGSL